MAAEGFWALVPAAGVGARMGGAIPKQYLELAGRPLMAHTLEVLLGHPRLGGVMVVLGAGDAWWPTLGMVDRDGLMVTVGGAERCHSVVNGLAALAAAGAGDDDWVLVHDAARPCLRRTDVSRLMDELAGHAVGGLLGLPVRDTMKRADANGAVQGTVSREGLWHALTPQMFRLGPLRAALEVALAVGGMVTDEAEAMERAGHRPCLVEGSPDNIKVTHPADLALAALYLEERHGGNPMNRDGPRIGQGYDAHRFAAGERLVLGGVTIPHSHGLAAHSDGDVLLHALCDALLGAAALGDIGYHFPDRSPEFAGVDSRLLLRRVMTMLQERGYAVGNVDCTVVAQAPRLAPHVPAMVAHIAADLGIPVQRVNVKATTTEGMGFSGRKEGIAAHAVALIHGP